MKKKLVTLGLNKQKISNLVTEEIIGGRSAKACIQTNASCIICSYGVDGCLTVIDEGDSRGVDC